MRACRTFRGPDSGTPIRGSLPTFVLQELKAQAKEAAARGGTSGADAAATKPAPKKRKPAGGAGPSRKRSKKAAALLAAAAAAGEEEGEEAGAVEARGADEHSDDDDEQERLVSWPEGWADAEVDSTTSCCGASLPWSFICQAAGFASRTCFAQLVCVCAPLRPSLQACDWEANPAEHILAETTSGLYLVSRQGLGFSEYGLVRMRRLAAAPRLVGRTRGLPTISPAWTQHPQRHPRTVC
jgi:hypothetical protein